MSRCPWTSSPARTPTAHAPEGDSRGRLPHSRRGHGRGLGPDAPRRRKPLRRGRPGWRPRGRADNGQGPPSITGRLRSAADGAQAAADLVGAGAAGLAAAQASRSSWPETSRRPRLSFAVRAKMSVAHSPRPLRAPGRISFFARFCATCARCRAASGVRSNGLCPQSVFAAGGLVPVGFKHSWLSTSHYLL